MSRDAQVHICKLPPGPGGEKTGLDDFFARGATVEQLLETARPAGETLQEISNTVTQAAHRMEAGRTIWSKPTREGEHVDVVLANF